MNFKVIDGDNDWLNMVPEFSSLYNDRKVPRLEIMKRLNLSQNTYKKLRRHCIENNLIVSRKGECKRNHKTHPEYIHRARLRGVLYFQIKRTWNWKCVYYGSYRNYEDAVAIRDKLIECDWDKNELDRIKKEVLGDD